jgi:hypothetical protein
MATLLMERRKALSRGNAAILAIRLADRPRSASVMGLGGVATRSRFAVGELASTVSRSRLGSFICNLRGSSELAVVELRLEIHLWQH